MEEHDDAKRYLSTLSIDENYLKSSDESSDDEDFVIVSPQTDSSNTSIPEIEPNDERVEEPVKIKYESIDDEEETIPAPVVEEPIVTELVNHEEEPIPPTKIAEEEDVKSLIAPKDDIHKTPNESVGLLSQLLPMDKHFNPLLNILVIGLIVMVLFVLRCMTV
jgi:hypothetical protein